MQDGRIVDDGPKAEMLTEARLSALFGTQVRLYSHDGYYHAS
jgi:iron complex transport system ATP-binding protein